MKKIVLGTISMTNKIDQMIYIYIFFLNSYRRGYKKTAKKSSNEQDMNQ